MRVRISDAHTGESYVATCEDDCKDKTDLSVYQLAVERNDVITQGKIIAEPLVTAPEVTPHFSTYPNPFFKGGNQFVSYEIQTCREFEDAGENRFFEPVTTQEACAEDYDVPGAPIGPVMFGIYGRGTDGLVEHISDACSVESAQDLLRRMCILE